MNYEPGETNLQSAIANLQLMTASLQVLRYCTLITFLSFGIVQFLSQFILQVTDF